MKALSILIVTLLATLAVSNFIPVPAYNLSELEGVWYVQSAYDSTGNDMSMMYCLGLNFSIINSSAVTITYSFYQSFTGQATNTTVVLYPDNGNPAILYQDADHQQPPLLIVNTSSLPYWSNESTAITIFAVNYTQLMGTEAYLIMGASRAYDTAYDIRPYLNLNNFPVSNMKNYWFVNSACNTHFGWKPVNDFNFNKLVKNWNLLAVYEPAGSNLVPWYTGGGIYDWQQAYCAQFTIIAGAHYSYQIILSLKSLLQGDFQRTWIVSKNPAVPAEIYGFNIDANTLLYVQYADIAGNLILTAGTTTSFFLSTSSTTLSPALKDLFITTIATMGYAEYDTDFITPIDNSNCGSM